MIDPRPVTDALLAVLAATTEKVGDLHAPALEPTDQRYFVLEPLSAYPDGGFGAPEHCTWFEYRLRSVAFDPTNADARTGPRMDAEALAHIGRSALLDRTDIVSGADWRITGREWVSSATEVEGPTVNVIDDIRVFVAPD